MLTTPITQWRNLGVAAQEAAVLHLVPIVVDDRDLVNVIEREGDDIRPLIRTVAAITKGEAADKTREGGSDGVYMRIICSG